MISGKVNKKTLGAAVVWSLNIAALLVYILTYKVIEVVYSKLIFGWSCFLTLVFISYSVYNGFESERHKGMVILTSSSLSIYFLFIILYYQFGIDDYKSKIGVFLLIEFITVCFVVISGLKLGLFKNERDML